MIHRNPILLLLPAIAALLLSASQHLAAQTRSLTLDSALRIADEQSIDIRMARLAVERSGRAVESARRLLLPEISASAGYYYNPQRQVLFVAPDVPFNESGTTQAFPIGSRFSTGLSVNITQPLYDPLARGQRELAESDVQVTKAQLEIARQAVRLNVEKAFYRALYARNEQRARDRQIEEAQKNLDLTLARFRGGRAMPLDTLTATASLARAHAESERAHYNYLGERLVLAQMLDLPGYDSLQVEGELDIPLPPGPSGGAMINPNGRIASAEARAAEARRIAAETDVRYQGLTTLPTLDAVASWNTNGQSNSISPGEYRWAMTSQVGLSLYYPIFNFWRSDPKREEAQMRVREAELELERIRKGDSTQQQQILLTMEGARAQLRAEEASSEGARKALEIAQILYKEGRATLLDVETAQSRVVEAGLAEDRAKLQFLTAYADLKAIVAEGP